MPPRKSKVAPVQLSAVVAPVVAESDSSEDENMTRVKPKLVRAVKEKKVKVAKAKRPLNNWASALQKWNKAQDDGIYIIPRKGTKEHSEVMAMMEKLKV